VDRPSSAFRWLLAPLGVGCFALGAVGIFVPGLPTTVFLLLGSFLLTKSCPWVERRLLAMPLFRPYARYLDPSTPMPRRARIVSIGAMWTSILAAVVLIVIRGTGGVWLPGLLVAAGGIGTIVILRFRHHLRHLPAPTASPLQPGGPLQPGV